MRRKNGRSHVHRHNRVDRQRPRNDAQGGDLRVYIATGKLDLGDVKLGDSIAVNGVCLTAVELPGDGFWADVSRESLARTAFQHLKVGSRVNLERP